MVLMPGGPWTHSAVQRTVLFIDSRLYLLFPKGTRGFSSVNRVDAAFQGCSRIMISTSRTRPKRILNSSPGECRIKSRMTEKGASGHAYSFTDVLFC